MSVLSITVQQLSGPLFQLIVRPAAMVMWLSVYAEQINQTYRGSVTFDWEGSSLRPQLHTRYDRINTDNLLPASDQSST